MSYENVNLLFSDIISRSILKKAVFSKPEDKSVIKETVTLKERGGETVLFSERFTKDNKVFHRTIPLNGTDELTRMAVTEYRQVNLITTAGDAEIKRSKSGTVHISGKLSSNAKAAEITSDGKNYIIDASRDIGFLKELGLADKDGRIHDKKQAKYRQINRFLEIVRDIEDKLPTERPAIIYDLCCGKSYLTFAVYYYFTAIKKRQVRMYGVDLKADVIEYCNSVATRQGFENLKFVSGNINEYLPPEAPDMVISLHACDIATDIVLANAVKWGAGVILSTPCCHHEMSKQLTGNAEGAVLKKELSFILDHPMLKQKFCDAATDALRAKRLESVGYSVTTLELIDPDETPKNLMIRAVKNRQMPTINREAALREYMRLVDALGINPFLDRLIKENEK